MAARRRFLIAVSACVAVEGPGHSDHWLYHWSVVLRLFLTLGINPLSAAVVDSRKVNHQKDRQRVYTISSQPAAIQLAHTSEWRKIE